MATEKIVLEVDVKGNAAEQINKAAASTQTLRQELKQLTLELQGLEPGSEQFNKLNQRAGQLKDQINDTNAAINATSGAPLENLGKSLSGVASIGIRGFQGVVSAQALLGGESKALQATMVKLQAVAGLASAIESLGGLKDQITNIKAGFSAFTTSAKIGLQGVKGAVAATGIGLLVIAVGLLVAYWDDIKGAMTGVSAEQEKLNTLAEANVQAEKQKLESLSLGENSLRLQGYSEKQILQFKIQQLDAMIKATENQIEQGRITFESQYAAEKRNRDILKGILIFLNAPLLLILKTIDEIAAFAGFDTNLAGGLLDFASGLVFDEGEVKANYKKTYDEQVSTLKKLKSDRDGFELEIRKIDKQAAEDRARVAKQGLEDSKLNDAERLKAKRELQDAELELLDDGLAKELLANQYKYERLIEDTNLNEKLKNKEKEKLNAAFRAEQTQQEGEIKIADEKRTFEKQKQDAQNAAAELQLNRELEDGKYLVRKTTRDKDIARMKDGFEKEKALREAAFEDELQDFSKLQFEKTAEREKIFQDEKSQLGELFLSKKITQEEYDNYLKDSEKAKTDELLIINEDYNAAVVKATEFKNEDIAELNKQAAKDEREEKIASLSAIMSAIEGVATDASKAIASALGAAIGGISDFLTILNTDFKEGMEGTMEKIGAYAQAIGGILSGFVGAMDEANQERLDNQLQSIDNETSAEKEALKARYDSGLIQKEEYEKGLGDFDKKAKADKLVLEQAAFEKDKKIKIAGAVIAGLQGAVVAFTSAFSLGPIAGPIVGGILVAAIAAMTAMNIQKIKASKFEGGDVSAGGGGGGAVSTAGAGGGAEAPIPPSLSLFGQALPGSEGAGQQGAGMRQQTIRAVVVESDITGTQNRLSNYQQRAEVG